MEDFNIYKSLGNSSDSPQKIQFRRTSETFITRTSAIAKLKSITYSEGSPVIVKYRKDLYDDHTYLILAIGTGSGLGLFEIVSDSEITLEAIDDQTNGSKGGLWTVENESQRLNIPEDKREIGMLVFQKDEGRYYVLNVDNEWEVFKPETGKIDGGVSEEGNHNLIKFFRSNEIKSNQEEAIKKLESESSDLEYGEPMVVKYKDGSDTKLLLGIGSGVPENPVMIIGSLDDTKDSLDKVYEYIGDLNDLITVNKSDLVSSINEIKVDTEELKKRVDTIQGDDTVEGSIEYYISEYDKTLSIDPGEF